MKHLATVLLIAVAAPLAAQQPPQPQNASEAFMMQFDANKDGKVSLEEFTAPQVEGIEQQFGYMDKNGDGSVDQAEIEAFSEEMRQRMQQMRQQQQQQGGSSR